MYVADVWCHDEQVSEAKEVPSIIRQVLKEVKWEGTALSLDVRALKASTVLVFDIGVFAVVVGLVLTLLRTLGAEAER